MADKWECKSLDAFIFFFSHISFVIFMALSLL